jgi:hypothetical protein
LVGTGLLGYAGYIGGITILDETSKGTAGAQIPGIVHTKIGFVVQPIGVSALVASLGVLLGVVSLFLSYRKANPR